MLRVYMNKFDKKGFTTEKLNSISKGVKRGRSHAIARLIYAQT